jgi:putative ABC transport system ATP-binding protein
VKKLAELLKIEALEKYYGNEKGIVAKAINDVSLEINSGEFVGIMGASGSGKTTLLNMVATIDTPSAGHIYIDGVDISSMPEKELAVFRGGNIGFVFQDYNLLDILTVYENIALSLTMLKESASFIHREVEKIARVFGIYEFLDKYPYEISGGQRQRCACARAVIKEPKIILADEPTGALDSKSAKDLMNALQTMNTKLSCTILMATHDAVTASYCEKILFLQDGRIYNQIIKGEKTRRKFFNEILDVLAIWGGGFNDIR